MAKIRVYETTDHPIARQMLGYLFVRGGVHALAYAKALEELTGVDVKKMLPIPAIPDADFKEARRFTDQGMHAKLYRFSETDFDGIRASGPAIARSTAPRSRSSTGCPRPPAAWRTRRHPAVSSPALPPDELGEVVKRLMKNM